MDLTTRKFEKRYWNYYLNLEKEFLKLEDYIPIIEENFKTISPQYMKLLMSICSEIDVVFKDFMKFVNKSEDNNMGVYRTFIQDNYKSFLDYTLFSSKNFGFYPFKDWKENNKLFWWDAYTSLKHDRNRDNVFYKANLFNVLNALGALYQLESYFHMIIVEKENSSRLLKLPLPQSSLFRVNWEYNENIYANKLYLDLNNPDDWQIYGPDYEYEDVYKFYEDILK